MSDRGVKLTTRLYLVAMLKIRESIPSLPQYVFMGWCLIKQGILHGVDNWPLAFTIQVVVFWTVTPCNEVVGHQCFGRLCWLLLQNYAEVKGKVKLPGPFSTTTP